MQPSGRASHRGGAKGEPRPGADVAGLTERMGGMGMTERRGRRGDVVVVEPHTRPETCKDKRGT